MRLKAYMKTKLWLGRKSVVRLAAVAPSPDPTNLSQECPTGRLSFQSWKTTSALVVPPLPHRSRVFELVPIELLPAFDAYKTLKTMLFTQDQIRRINSFRRQWRHVIAFMLQIGNLLMLLSTATPRRLGCRMSVLAPMFQLPGMTFILGSLRVEMLFLLFGTYDFWYFTVNNIAFGVCFSILLSDVRILGVWVGCVIVQISIGADALVGDRRQLFLSSVINCGTHLALFFVVFLKLVDNDGNADVFVFSYSNRSNGFSIRDILMNTQLNMVLLFGRLVYKNWVAMREQDSAIARRVSSQTSYIPSRRRCVSYYCTVGLRPKCNSIQFGNVRRGSTCTNRWSTDTPSRVGSVLSTEAFKNASNTFLSPLTEPPSGGPRRFSRPQVRLDRPQNRIRTQSIQLQFVPVEEAFDAYETLLPGFGSFLDRVFGLSPLNTRRRMTLHFFHTLGYIGIGTLVLGALIAWITNDRDLDHIWPGLAQTQVLAFFTSLVYCGIFFAAYQRQLLRQLYSSFNFIFLAAKLTTVSLVLCQFLGWDRRMLWVWSAWLWIHWAITLDALPPSSIRLLAFQCSTLMLCVLAFELFGLFCLSLELLALNRWIVPNVALFDRVVFGRHLHLSALSTLVSRLWTIFLWECKFAWFISAALRRQRHRRSVFPDSIDDSDGERLLLTGRVQYFYELETQTRPRAAKLRWRRSFQVFRISRAIQRRRAKGHLHKEDG